MRVSIGIGFMLILMFLCYPALSTEQRRIALVIGNDNYQKVSKLEKAGNDATAMARELKAAGFEVMEYRDLNYQSMVKAVEVFSNRINGGDQVVVFFAGHGVQIKTGSYLLPIDIDAGSERQVEKTAYGLNDLTDRLSEAKASFVLVMVDACRDNPLKAKGRSVGNTRGLSAIEPPKGQMVVYSASRGQQALDRLSDQDDNPNGIFTRSFVAKMKKPGVRIEDMMREVQDAVEELAQSVSHEQRPAIYNESRGNFYFFGPTTVNVQPSAPSSSQGKSEVIPAPLPVKESKPVAAAQEDPETKFWNEVKTIGSGEYFDAYLKKYPKGKYVSLAKIELKKLDDRKKAEKAREKEEQHQAAEQLKATKARAAQEAWEQTKSDNTIAAYANFLTKYPESQFVVQAQTAQQKIVRDNAEQEKQEAARKRSEALKQEQQAQEAAARQQEELARQRREVEEKAKAARVEQASWEQTKTDNTIAAYANFLTRYPKSHFVTQAQVAQQKIVRDNAEREKQEAARKRSKALKQEQQVQETAARQQEELARQRREAEETAKAARVEQESWDQAKSDHTIAAYVNFLTRYPASQFVALAQAAQQKILRETAELTYRDPNIGMEFVLVKGGCSQMDETSGDGSSDGKPAHEVCVGDYYLGKFEVTQGEWETVMGSNPSAFKKGPRYPVEQVSWAEAQSFIGKLKAKSGNGYRLPTEAEWEYAAQSGEKSEKYAGGDEVDSGVWYKANSGLIIHEVGTRQANGLGLHDMSGNVWEWVEDWSVDNYHKNSQRENSQGLSIGVNHAFRGGSLGLSFGDVRAAYRYWNTPGFRHDVLGFRVALSLDQMVR